MATRVKRPETSGFKISIVEDHDQALLEIYNEIGRKRLNFNNLILVHFDSHPDLGIPAGLDADSIFVKDKLVESLSIENWILPAVFAGHLNKIVWIRPPWSTQIKVGKYDLVIGKDVKSGRLKCNCNESYFKSDMSYAHESNLIDRKPFLLYVCDFYSIVANIDEYLLEIIRSSTTLNSKNDSLVLDIDLDFFSTQDPFQLMFANNDDYGIFKRVYKVTPKDLDYESFLKDKLAKLAGIKAYLIDNSSELNDDLIELKPDLDRLHEIIETDGLDFEVLHEYGSCLDDEPLPHHVSTNEKVIEMLDKFESFLNKYFSFKVKPGLVTVARSSDDDYCPRDQVDFIQQELITKLASFFNPKFISSICKNYLNDS